MEPHLSIGPPGAQSDSWLQPSTIFSDCLVLEPPLPVRTNRVSTLRYMRCFQHFVSQMRTHHNTPNNQFNWSSRRYMMASPPRASRLTASLSLAVPPHLAAEGTSVPKPKTFTIFPSHFPPRLRLNSALLCSSSFPFSLFLYRDGRGSGRS